MIEVETRSLLTDEEYANLLNILNRQAKYVNQEEQETHYLDSAIDLRIMKSNKTKLWMKSGKMHDNRREEIEIIFEKNDFEKLLKIFEKLGMKAKLKWFRKRITFTMGELTLTLDDTLNYGKILEVEKMCNEHEVEKSEKEIKSMLKKLGVKETPKEIFEKKYAEYVKLYSL